MVHITSLIEQITLKWRNGMFLNAHKKDFIGNWGGANIS